VCFLLGDLTVIAAFVVLGCCVLLSALVLGYVMFPHRRRPIPGAPAQVGEVVASAEQRLGLTGDAPPHGLLGSRERDRRASQRFERLEQRVAGSIRRDRRPAGRPGARRGAAPRRAAGRRTVAAAEAAPVWETAASWIPSRWPSSWPFSSSASSWAASSCSGPDVAAGVTSIAPRPAASRVSVPSATRTSTAGHGAPVRTVDTLEPTDALVEREPPTIERPAPTEGRLVRLRARLARSQGALGKGLLALLSRDTLDEDTWEEVEDVLLRADIGVAPTQELVERLRTRVKVAGSRTPAEVRALLREELLELVGPDLDRSLATARHPEGRPAVILVVGVNGTGKTTTVGKLARVLVAEDRDVLLGAADTFRAAAADQLETWGTRVGVPTVRGTEGGDPRASRTTPSVRASSSSPTSCSSTPLAGCRTRSA
jgi:hypothetical protein